MAYAGVVEYYVERAQLRRADTPPSLIIRFPKRLSFIELPDDALRVAEEYIAAARDCTAQLQIDQTACEHIDLCGSALVNALFRHMMPYRRPWLAAQGVEDPGELRRLRYAGFWPRAQAAAEIVAATGLPKELGVPLPPRLAQLEHFLYHGLVEGSFTGNRAASAGRADEEATRLVLYLDDCFKKYGYQLTIDGADYLGGLVAEVINNCEDHSGRNEWWVSAYLRQSAGASYGDCHIALFNLGQTMAETLQELPSTAMLRRSVDDLMARHRRKRHFGGQFTEEAAWTLCALQPRVSCRNDDENEVRDRGQGTVKLIQAFHHLGRVKSGAEQPLMALVSGRTHIIFDGSPLCQLRPLPVFGDETPNIIAFNAANSLAERPDPNYVRVLQRTFPGTMISLRFFIDPQHLADLPDYVHPSN